jgi:RimJ/RimL family protein N-acetyltransferase
MRRRSPHIETERLIVRRFEERDVADILDYSKHDASDEHRRRNVDWELSEEGVRKWWSPMKTMPVDEATEWLGLVVEVKALARVVGNTGFNVKKLKDQRQGMIGWILGEAFEGNGYMTEGVTALLDYLFFTEGFHRAYAMTSPDNHRSWRLMERLGMRREAHFVKNCYHDDGWVDEYVYAILAEEWAASRKGA